MNEIEIENFLSQRNYDIRKTNNGRWIDQKCTMDVVCLVADCIVEYVKLFPDKEFTVNDIWFSDYAAQNVQDIFSKPNPATKARCEYDKYFGQPIKMMAAAGILAENKRGKRNEKRDQKNVINCKNSSNATPKADRQRSSGGNSRKWIFQIAAKSRA